MENSNNTLGAVSSTSDRSISGGGFFIAVIHHGGDENLSKTLWSIFSQSYDPTKIEIKIFHPARNRPLLNLQEQAELISFETEAEFFSRFTGYVSNAKAEYFVSMRSGDTFFDQALNIVGKTFEDYPQIDWLTGIQTVEVASGFNVFLGSIATRRWNFGLFELNLYKKSARYIPPGSTFWRRRLWHLAGAHLYFVLQKSFWEDIWLAFFKVSRLYTSNIYISSTIQYDAVQMEPSAKNIQYSLIEDGFVQKLQEFFFINNVPYLRLYYSKKNKLANVIRYDHKQKSCFLNEY